MRTQEEIVERLKKSDSMFGFDSEVMVPYLDFIHAKQFLKDGVTQDQWSSKPRIDEEVKKEAKTYMGEFGWDKAQNHRGISAGRTIEKMTAWAWLLGEDDLIKKVEETDYQQYGAPKLKAICEHFKWPIPTDKATLRMTEGLPCEESCESGCGQ